MEWLFQRDSEATHWVARRGSEILDIASSADGRSGLLPALVSAVSTPATQRDALELLHWIRKNPREGHPLSVVRVPLTTGVVSDSLDLLMVPGIFEPEDWGYTFLEGLLRRPESAYQNKVAVELGTGSGWISLALLRLTGLKRVFGIDINSIALQVAQINAYLNSFDDHFRPQFDGERRLMHERFEVFESNLLSEIKDRSHMVDMVLGCIPQVLAPSPDLDIKEALEQRDEDRLYDLSNYFLLQGVYEDQFGLGLLARAIEESIEVLNPRGAVVLNIAGRPGTPIIESMFARRGFAPSVVWETRVQQAADTDIKVLADLEARTGNPFEFYINRHSRQPIGAGTAEAIRSAGQPIWHNLRVYEGTLNFEPQLRPFFASMRQLGLTKMLDQVDLSEVDSEQISFLRRLAFEFCRSATAPYTHEAGCIELRNLISTYLERYFRLRFPAEQLFIGPSREVMGWGLLTTMCEPGDTVLVSQHCKEVYHKAIFRAGVEAVYTNDDIAETALLVETLRPKVVLSALVDDERRNFAAFSALLESAKAVGATIILDGSDDFQITSRLHENPLFEASTRVGLDGRLLLLCGLTRNTVYPGLQPAFVVGASHKLVQALEVFAEATYSRNDTFAELYYRHLFEEILQFQLARPSSTTQEFDPNSLSTPELSSRVRTANAWPAFTSWPPYESARTLIRLDYGENEVALPPRLVQGLLLGFTNLGEQVVEANTREAVAGYLGADASHLVLGSGVFPLLHDAAVSLGKRLGRPARVAIPDGHYGYFPPIFSTAGAEVVRLETKEEDGWLLNQGALDARKDEFDAVLINHPTNPLGVAYPRATLESLLAWAEANHKWVFCDEIFGGLTYGETHCSALELKPSFKQLLVFDGLSKSFAAGGLRVGWAAARDPAFARCMRHHSLLLPARHALVATEALFAGFRPDGTEEARAEVHAEQSALVSKLSARRDTLVSTLKDFGLDVAGPKSLTRAGLFVSLDCRPLYRDGEDGDAFAIRFREETGLQINRPTWAGLKDHARLCFSLRDDRFHQTIARLKRYCREHEF